jgi:signal transduction histidine kinase
MLHTMDSPVDTEPTQRERFLLEPARLLRILGLMTFAGGVLTFVSLLAPHEDTTYDLQFWMIGVAFLLFGPFVLWAARHTSRPGAVHAVTLVLSIMVLLLAWLGMRDLGGVDVVYLFSLLALGSLVGNLRATLLLFAVQSAGYAVVLSTATTAPGFDQPSQWLVVTIGLALAVLYNVLVRRQLELSTAHEAAVRDEQAHQRAAHAEQLEQLNTELREANELKSRFVAMASHELRTPLTAISGFASTMRNRWGALTDDDKHRFVEIIDEQADRLGRLVTDLLTLSRIESGRLDANVRPVPVREVIDRTVRELGIDDVRVEGDAQVQALADEDYLQQILINYLGNASAYGEPPVTVSVAVTNGWVELLVSDCGPGVPSEFVPKLFDRFARGPVDVRPDMPSGTGLGLSIVEGLAHAHGGTAWYEPNQPSGSRFGVRLPAARVEA